MDKLDALYRAFADYKTQTEQSRECGVERDAVACADTEADSLKVVRTLCAVDYEWINAIEEGLVHIEKALNECRQFIRSSGDVVPIEKVKRVSKDSVTHLAKHSDFITKQTGDEDGNGMVPDKLYIVERLSDFTVYENRFLYMLLCYLESFVTLRYNKILELTNTYSGSAAINKTVVINRRRTVFEMKLKDESPDDKYLREHNPLQPVIDRIDLILKTIIHFLANPIMQETAKVPMLKAPVTKTNVLKMNRNFKGAAALYDFITAYDKPGYTVERNERSLSPFSDTVAGELAHTVMLSSFLVYKHGLGLEETLKSAYAEEEERRRLEREREIKEQLARLKMRLKEAGRDPFEYISMLEKTNKILEADSERLADAELEIEKLRGEAEALNENIERLNAEAEEAQAEMTRLKAEHAEETLRLKTEHAEEIARLNAEHGQEITELNSRHKEKTDMLCSEHDKTVSALKEAHEAENAEKDGIIAEVQTRLTEETAQLKKTIEDAEAARIDEITEIKSRLEGIIAEKSAECENIAAECESVTAAKKLSDSRLNALRKEYNLIAKDEDFTAQASFAELEHQYAVFKTFFKDEWKKTKKKIRKEILKSESNKEEAGK